MDKETSRASLHIVKHVAKNEPCSDSHLPPVAIDSLTILRTLGRSHHCHLSPASQTRSSGKDWCPAVAER